jgi:selenide,water dikinase
LRLISAGQEIAQGTLPSTQEVVKRELEKRGAEILLGNSVVRVRSGILTLDDGRQLEEDLVLWTTSATAPPLLACLGLATDDRGFLLTDSTLRCIGNVPIFAVGDSGTIENSTTPKAGVYAVRQGPILWKNIQRLVAGRSDLIAYRPQRHFLKILNTGDGRAIAEYHGTTFHSVLSWKLKDWIDTRFVGKYQC